MLSRSVMSNCTATRLLCPRDFPDKNTGVSCHFLLQGIFPTHGSNPGLLHWRFFTTESPGKPLIYQWKKKKVSFDPKNILGICEESIYKISVYSLCVSHLVVSDSLQPHRLPLPGSFVHGILQARILEWVAVPFSRGSSWPRDWTQLSCISSRLFAILATLLPQLHILELFSELFMSHSQKSISSA